MINRKPEGGSDYDSRDEQQRERQGREYEYYGNDRNSGVVNPPRYGYPGQRYEGERNYDYQRGSGPTSGRESEYSDYGSGYNRRQETYGSAAHRSLRDERRYSYGDRNAREGGRDSAAYDENYNAADRGWLDMAGDEVASWFGDQQAAARRRLDMKNSSAYRGRGPRGYKRSDARIEEDINDHLTYDSYIDAEDITVKVENGEVTLTGTVPSRYEKRHAEDIAESVAGVSNVENRLRVKQPYYNNFTGNSGSSEKTLDTQSSSIVEEPQRVGKAAKSS